MAAHPLDIPKFLRRKKGDFNAAAWDAFMARQRREAQAPVKVDWRKPVGLSNEEWERIQARSQEVQSVKAQVRKMRAVQKVNTVGKRWDINKSIWVDDATGAPAPTALEELKAMRAAARDTKRELRAKVAVEKKKAQAAVPTTGILAEFNCKPDTFRATLLLTLEKSLGKMLSADALTRAVYAAPAKEKLSNLVMVIKGARETIVKLKLPYELKDKANCSWGLFKMKNGKREKS